MAATRIALYDTTLRDGTQSEDFTLSVEDKVRVALQLDDLGIDYIEGGWPGSNPRDIAFFREIRNHSLAHARVAAFGSTCHPSSTPETDRQLQTLLEASCDVVTIFGKSWTVQVTEALRATLERNLEMIAGSVAFLRGHVAEVVFDAEHFFDGYKTDPAYALAALRAASESGADVLVLCDTNGGSLPSEIAAIVQAVREELPDAPLGIHAHNDCEMGVANSIAAIQHGAVHVQGTINGVGERCGNANLCSIIPNLTLKLGLESVSDEDLRKLQRVSNFVAEVANRRPDRHQPFVGKSAFAHKGGVHTSAVLRNPRTYEHVRPELVGNTQRILVSDLAGLATVTHKAKTFGIRLEKGDPVSNEVLRQVKERENEGYQYEAAEASFELLLLRALGTVKKYFHLLGFRVIDVKHSDDEQPVSEASIRVTVGGDEEHTAALGDGPVNALDNALRKALEKYYRNLEEMRLSDYKVRVLPGTTGTGAKVKVLIESTDGKVRWGTVGASHDILEASWQALTDSYTYKLHKDECAAAEAAQSTATTPGILTACDVDLPRSR